MRSGKKSLTALLLILTTGACNGILGLQELQPGEASPDAQAPRAEAGLVDSAGVDASTADVDGGSDAGSDAGAVVDAGGDAGSPDAGPCPGKVLRSESVNLVDDALIASTDNEFGLGTTCNMAVGRCVMKFSLSQQQQSAFDNSQVLRLGLTLTRASTSSDCANPTGTDCTTATFRQSGNLTVRPLRTDWVEASVSWISLNKPLSRSWGAPGAMGSSDQGAVVGTLDNIAADESPTIALTSLAAFNGFRAGQLLGLVTDFSLNGTNRQFVMVTKNPGAAPVAPPVLTIRYCGGP